MESGNYTKSYKKIWDEFSFADSFDDTSVLGVYDRIFEACKRDYMELTALISVLNNKTWQHHRIPGHERICRAYCTICESAEEYAEKTLTGKEAKYYQNTMMLQP